jgi:hypothetical protein
MAQPMDLSIYTLRIPMPPFVSGAIRECSTYTVNPDPNPRSGRLWQIKGRNSSGSTTIDFCGETIGRWQYSSRLFNSKGFNSLFGVTSSMSKLISVNLSCEKQC